MELKFRPHEVLTFTAGKYAGLAGEVLEFRPDTQMVRLHVAGVKDGQTVDFKAWFKAKQTERLQ